MSASKPDIAASDLSSEPSSPEGGTGGKLLGQWLRALLQVGLVLVLDMRFITDPRSQQGESGETDRLCARHCLAWELVARARRWTRALQARLAAEARAEMTGMSPETERLNRAARLFDRPEWYKSSTRRPRAEDATSRPGARGRADDCIAGMPVAEVVGQICADLSTAATLLVKSKALGIIVRIAEAARAMLGGPDAAWKARPIGPVTDGAPSAAIQPVAAMGLRVPDTG
jgi:hypothetical protein